MKVKHMLAAPMSALLLAASMAMSQQPTTQPKPAPAFKIEEIAGGLRAPWSIAFLADGRVFFTEREGRVRAIDKNGRLEAEPVLTVPDIKSWTKMGLLGLALSPVFAQDHFVFLAENYGDDTHNYMRVVRYRERDGKLIEPTKLALPSAMFADTTRSFGLGVKATVKPRVHSRHWPGADCR